MAISKKKIIRLKDEGEGFLYYLNERTAGDEIIDSNPKPKLEELAQFCDLNAESRNDHEYIGAHRLLAALLFKKVGRDKATEIMLEIAEYGGLDYMVGMDGQKPVYEELGITRPWKEWNLPTGTEEA